MKDTGHFAVIAILSVVGGCLLFNADDDRRGTFWYESYLETVQRQLAGIEQHLLNYREEHGRYPTNDEGLAALDSFEPLVTTAVYYHHTDILAAGMPSPFERRGLWDVLRRRVGSWRESFERDPDELKRELASLRDPTVEDPHTRAELVEMGFLSVPVEIALGHDDEIYLLSPAGVFSPWFIPYVYENRRGLDADAFRHSPVDADDQRRFSVQVDDGIYVYSVSGEIYANELYPPWWELHLDGIVGGGLLAAALVHLLLVFNHFLRPIARAFFVLVGAAAIGAVAGNMSFTTCYISFGISYYRHPKAIARQRELLEQYRRRGVIGNEAYHKTLRATGPEPKSD